MGQGGALDPSSTSSSSPAEQSGGQAGQGGGGQGGGGQGGGGQGGGGQGGGGQGGINLAGTALQFDGNDDFVSAQRPVADDFTIEAWIQATASRSGTEYSEGLGLIYAGASGTADDFGTSILNDRFSFGVGVPSLGQNVTVQSTTRVTTGAWFHVAAVRTMSTGEIVVFINGVEESSASTENTGPLDAQLDITIGGNTLSDRYYAGQIDEVRIWSIARTAAQIQATMNQQLDGDEAGLVSYYRFDEDSGSIAVDSTTHGNDGSLGDGSVNSEPDRVTSDAPIF